MEIIIGEGRATCGLCLKEGEKKAMIGVKSGNAYHPSCTMRFVAEMADSTLVKRKERLDREADNPEKK